MQLALRMSRLYSASIVTLGIGIVGLLQACSTADSSILTPIEAQIEVGGETIQLEVARTPQEWATGLMFRSSLPDHRGMVFLFERPRYPQFWMKNVAFPLDIIFLRNHRIQKIVTAPPCAAKPCPKYRPDEAVDSVIELPGGRAAELGLQEGDRLHVEFLEISPDTRDDSRATTATHD